MITGSQVKEAADSPDKSNNKPSSANSSSWLRLKDPRIVRVSRAFGGKDRHSKVCTVRGLRDRRVRLSVPTAIQLYDLQDRLGLSQPSKVVDWLLNAAKDEIDELPPLQMPPVSFPRSQELLEASTTSQVPGKQGNIDWNEAPRSGLWNIDATNNGRGKSKEVEVAKESQPSHSQSSLSFLPYGSLCQWDPNNLTTFPLSQLGSSHGFMSHLEDVRHNNVALPSALSLSTTQPYSSFPFEIDPRQMNHFQMLSSSSNNNLIFPNNSSSSMRPFHFSMSAPRPQNSSGSEQNKDHER